MHVENNDLKEDKVNFPLPKGVVAKHLKLICYHVLPFIVIGFEAEMDGAFVQITDRTGAWTVDGITVLEPHPKNDLEVHRTVRVDELGIKA